MPFSAKRGEKKSHILPLPDKKQKAALCREWMTDNKARTDSVYFWFETRYSAARLKIELIYLLVEDSFAKKTNVMGLLKSDSRGRFSLVRGGLQSKQNRVADEAESLPTGQQPIGTGLMTYSSVTPI